MHLRPLPGFTYFRAPADDPPTPAPVEPPAPAPVPSVEPPAPAEPPTPAPAPVVAAPASDWKDKRIAELTAKLNEARKSAPAPVNPPAPALGESAEAISARIDAAANEKAALIAAANDWDNRCTAVVEAGKSAFPDFDARMKACQSVVNFADPNESAQFNSIVAAALETGMAHKLIHALGETPGEVKRLMGLPPMKVAVEIATRAAKLGAGPAAPEPSGAPAPIEPIGSLGKHYDGLDTATPNGAKLPIGEWMKQREKHVTEVGIQ